MKDRYGSDIKEGDWVIAVHENKVCICQVTCVLPSLGVVYVMIVPNSNCHVVVQDKTGEIIKLPDDPNERDAILLLLRLEQ